MWDFCKAFLLSGPQFAYLYEETRPDLQAPTQSAHGNHLGMPCCFQVTRGQVLGELVEELLPSDGAPRIGNCLSRAMGKWVGSGLVGAGVKEERKHCSVHFVFQNKKLKN